jgi:cytochrome d ubiquinol oxidase subunit I
MHLSNLALDSTIFDPLLLSRIQFGFTIAFHIIFPAFSIGLAGYLVINEALWLKTKNKLYRDIYQFWIKIFAISFGMGVVSGIPLSYQIGTNWSVFSTKVSNVIGPLFGFEVLTAFFLEASFLGIMLFGWKKVGPKIHFLATAIVAIGTLISAFWIIAANSWMQTPQGFEIYNGIFYPTSWLEIIFNPSFIYRFFHMTIAAYLATAFVVAGVSAWYLLKNIYLAHAKIMFKMSMLMIFIAIPLQIFIGDLHGLNTAKYQPAKLAAIEGIWENERGAGLKIFGIPNQEKEQTKYSIEIPKFASLIIKHDINGEIIGLKSFAKNERPLVFPVFWSFRVMVGIGVMMLMTGLIAAWLYYHHRLFTTRWFQLWCIFTLPIGFVAIIAGWFVTEMGRQPYIVYGLLRTSEAVSPILGQNVLISLVAFIAMYIFIFSAATYYILKLIAKGIKSQDQDFIYGDHNISTKP